MPALSATAPNNAVVYNSIAPRLGVTYALGKDRKTLLRASTRGSPTSSTRTFRRVCRWRRFRYYSYAYWHAVDTNGDGQIQPGERTTFIGVCCFNPTNPYENANKVGGYKTPMTDELVVRRGP